MQQAPSAKGFISHTRLWLTVGFIALLYVVPYYFVDSFVDQYSLLAITKVQRQQLGPIYDYIAGGFMYQKQVPVYVLMCKETWIFNLLVANRVLDVMTPK